MHSALSNLSVHCIQLWAVRKTTVGLLCWGMKMFPFLGGLHSPLSVMVLLDRSPHKSRQQMCYLWASPWAVIQEGFSQHDPQAQWIWKNVSFTNLCRNCSVVWYLLCVSILSIKVCSVNSSLNYLLQRPSFTECESNTTHKDVFVVLLHFLKISEMGEWKKVLCNLQNLRTLRFATNISLSFYSVEHLAWKPSWYDNI